MSKSNVTETGQGTADLKKRIKLLKKYSVTIGVHREAGNKSKKVVKRNNKPTKEAPKWENPSNEKPQKN